MIAGISRCMILSKIVSPPSLKACAEACAFETSDETLRLANSGRKNADNRAARRMETIVTA